MTPAAHASPDVSEGQGHDVNGQAPGKPDPEGANKQKLQWHRTWEEFLTEKDRQKHYLRASLEILGLVGIASLDYWLHPEGVKVDWDLEWDWPSWRKKLAFEAWSLDSNEFNTNMYHHPVAGSGFYIFGRANNLSDWESFLFSIGGSTVWELLAEFKEEVSINDMISTPVGGYAIGESMYKLYAFFSHSDTYWPIKAITAPLGGPKFIHNWTDKSPPRVSQNKGPLGMLTDYWHRFDFWAGVMTRNLDEGRWTGPLADMGMATKIIAIDGYGKSNMPTGAMYYDGVITQLDLDLTFDMQSIERAVFFCKAAPLGYFTQKIRQVGEEKYGWNCFIGPATAFEYYWENLEIGNLRNEYSMVDILGPTLDMAFFRADMTVRFVLNAFFHFSAVGTLAWDRIYVGPRPIERDDQGNYLYVYTKGCLQNEGFYWAIGPAVSSHLEVDYRPVRAAVDFWYDYFVSIEGLDRFQDLIVDDFGLDDSRYGYRLTGSCSVPYTEDLLRLSAAFEHHFMTSSVPGRAYVRMTEAILTGMLTFEF